MLPYFCDAFVDDGFHFLDRDAERRGRLLRFDLQIACDDERVSQLGAGDRHYNVTSIA